MRSPIGRDYRTLGFHLRVFGRSNLHPGRAKLFEESGRLDDSIFPYMNGLFVDEQTSVHVASGMIGNGCLYSHVYLSRRWRGCKH